RRLIGEQCIDAEAIPLERQRALVRAGLGIANDDWQIGARIVAQVVLAAGVVLADRPQENRSRHLVLDADPRCSPNRHGSAVAAPLVALDLILPIDPQLAARTPVG